MAEVAGAWLTSNCCFEGENNLRAAIDSSSSFWRRTRTDIFEERAESGTIGDIGDGSVEIVPIVQPEGGRVLIYVVWVGRAVGLFHNWYVSSHSCSN